MNRNENRRENEDVRIHMNNDMRKGKSGDPVTQLLMWLLPALLLGVLVYYLYQRYYQKPAEAVKTEEVAPVAPATETPAPAAPEVAPAPAPVAK